MESRMEILSDNYQRLSYDKELSMLEILWTELSVEMTAELLQEAMLLQLEIFKRFKPKRCLINCKTFFFKIPPKLQTWITNHFYSVEYEYGLEKMAFLISEDLIAQVSIEQTLADEPVPKFPVQYFDNEEDALIWFMR